MSDRYHWHIRSEEWASFREYVLEAKGRRCEHCRTWHGLQVHHLHYETLGNERLEDVALLCKRCHREADHKRRLEESKTTEDELVDRWATRRWGVDWRFDHDPEYVKWLYRRKGVE